MSKLSPRLAARVAAGIVGAGAAVRIYQATTGTVPIPQAAAEIGAVVGALVIGAVVIGLWSGTRHAGHAVQGATMILWAALVIVPTWRLGHQPAPLFDGVLAGAEREVRVGPATMRAVYELAISAPRAGARDDYVLVVKAGGEQRKLRGVFSRESDVSGLSLGEGDTATLFLERGGAAKVVVSLPRIPWRWIQLGALLVIAMACVGEFWVSRSRPRIRGLWTGVVSASVLYLLILGPAVSSGGAAVGAAMGAVFGGGLFGALWGAWVGRIHRRRR